MSNRSNSFEISELSSHQRENKSAFSSFTSKFIEGITKAHLLAVILFSFCGALISTTAVFVTYGKDWFSHQSEIKAIKVKLESGLDSIDKSWKNKIKNTEEILTNKIDGIDKKLNDQISINIEENGRLTSTIDMLHNNQFSVTESSFELITDLAYCLSSNTKCTVEENKIFSLKKIIYRIQLYELTEEKHELLKAALIDKKFNEKGIHVGPILKLDPQAKKTEEKIPFVSEKFLIVSHLLDEAVTCDLIRLLSERTMRDVNITHVAHAHEVKINNTETTEPIYLSKDMIVIGFPYDRIEVPNNMKFKSPNQLKKTCDADFQDIHRAI
ncbi:hypothetical protein ALT785_730009 [Alteromonas infernus]